MTAPAVSTLLQGGALAGHWVLDPGTSSIRIENRVLWGLVTVRGVFAEISGDGTVDPDGGVSGTLVVAAASVRTGNTRRDAHLRSPDFFDATEHRHIVFTAEAVHTTGQGATVVGALRVRGRTQTLTLPATISTDGPDRIGLDAEARIDREEFGLTWNRLGLVSTTTTVRIHAVFARLR